MTAEQLANKLDGCTEISDTDKLIARDNNLIIVYGYSDDNIEFEGAIRDEVGAYGGETVFFKDGDLLHDCDEPCEHCSVGDDKVHAKVLTAHWSEESDGKEYSWVMEAGNGINAYSFDMRENAEDDEYFCKGLVFNKEDIE
jgi:hypothetical protein